MGEHLTLVGILIDFESDTDQLLMIGGDPQRTVLQLGFATKVEAQEFVRGRCVVADDGIGARGGSQ